MTVIPARYWLIAVGAAVATHAMIGAALFWTSGESGAREAGHGGVEVALGPAGGAPGSALEVEGMREAETVVPSAADTQTVEEVEASEPKTAEALSARTALAAEVEPVETVDGSQQQPPRKPQPSAIPTLQPAKEVQPTAPAVSGADGQAGSGESSGAGRGDNATGGGVPGASVDYMARLRAWLEQHKRYPRRARLRRQQGTTMLSFVVDRTGTVVEYSIRESSGYRLLDEEAVAMIERAQPLPAFPEDMSQRRLQLVVPVQFFLM